MAVNNAATKLRSANKLRLWLFLGRFGLRTSLLLVLLPLLTLPWLGLRFVERMAEVARDERLENQASAARGLASALHERAELFRDVPQRTASIHNDAAF
jgi:hypothetical protein